MRDPRSMKIMKRASRNSRPIMDFHELTQFARKVMADLVVAILLF